MLFLLMQPWSDRSEESKNEEKLICWPVDCPDIFVIRNQEQPHTLEHKQRQAGTTSTIRKLDTEKRKPKQRNRKKVVSYRDWLRKLSDVHFRVK